MRYLIILLSLLVAICVANIVQHGDERRVDDYRGRYNFRPSHKFRSHKRKRDGEGAMKCGYGTCSEDSLFVYYKCCRTRSHECCWYLRMWVIVVFGVIALKAFLACFVSFFRCVCC